MGVLDPPPLPAPVGEGLSEFYTVLRRERDRLLTAVIGRGTPAVPHLERILRSYACHYNGHPPHQGIAQEIPVPKGPVLLRAVPIPANRHSHHRPNPLRICLRNRLGGLIHGYELAG